MINRNTKERENQLGKKLGNVTADLKIYIEKRVELVLLNLGEHLASWVAASIYRIAGVVVLLFGILFLLTALAIFVGELIGSIPLGYVIIAVPLIIFGWLFLYLKPANLMRKMEESLESEVIKAVSKIGMDDETRLKDRARLPQHTESESE